MDRKERAELVRREQIREQIQAEIWRLAAEGIIYDTGERRSGAIVWGIVPAKGLGDHILGHFPARALGSRSPFRGRHDRPKPAPMA
jgi:hypothetical protein